MGSCIQHAKGNISNTNSDTSDLECTHKGELSVTVYYSVFSVLWGVGWSAVKISHLSMLPVLAPSESNKMTLTTIIYAVEIISTIFLYGSSWLFIRTGK